MVDFGHYAPLWGEALLTGLAILIILLGSFMKGGKVFGYLSLAGLLASLGLVMSAETGRVFFFDTLSVDAISQFFKAVFLVVSVIHENEPFPLLQGPVVPDLVRINTGRAAAPGMLSIVDFVRTTVGHINPAPVRKPPIVVGLR